MADLTLKITSGPSLGASVRVDLNGGLDGIWLGERSSFDLGAPEISAVGVAGVVGPRTIALPLVVLGGDAAVSTALSKVAAALSRQGAYLLYQRKGGVPYWFRLIAPAAGSLSRKYVHQDPHGSAWQWPLQLVAEGCALMENRTLWTGTMQYNDAGLSVALPTPAGDMPAPAKITCELKTDGKTWGGANTIFGMCAFDPSAPVQLMPYARAVDFTDPGPDVQENSAAGTFGGGEMWSIAADKLPMLFSLSIPFPPGRYRVYARLTNPPDTGVQYRVGATFGSDIAWGDWRSWVKGGNPNGSSESKCWMDLGTMSLPIGVPVDSRDPQDWYYKDQRWAMEARNDFGAGSASRAIKLYGVLLVPEELASGGGSTILGAQWTKASAPQGSFRAVVDTANTRCYIDNGFDGRVWNASPPLVGGGYPWLVPRQRNVFLLLHNSGNAFQDAHNSNVAVKVEYQPRVLQPS